MQEGLKEKQSSASSRVSSFFIENILAGGQDGHRSASSSGGSAQTISAGGVQSTRPAESGALSPDTSDATLRRAYGESPMQWYRDASGLNFRPLDAAQSKCNDLWKCLLPDSSQWPRKTRGGRLDGYEMQFIIIFFPHNQVR